MCDCTDDDPCPIRLAVQAGLPGLDLLRAHTAEKRDAFEAARRERAAKDAKERGPIPRKAPPHGRCGKCGLPGHYRKTCSTPVRNRLTSRQRVTAAVSQLEADKADT